MSELQDLRSTIRELPKKESVEALQARLRRAGLEENLSAVPAAKVPETFVALMTSLLERLEQGLGSISVDEIRKTTAEVKGVGSALEPKPTAEVTAETILNAYKPNYQTGEYEITPPKALEKFGADWMQEAGKILNSARAESTDFPVFDEGHAGFWRKNEADPAQRTMPGRKYRLKIHLESVGKDKSRKIQEHGNGDKGTPIAALALAEACERLKTFNKNTLFKGLNGEQIGCVGLTPGVAIFSPMCLGVGVDGFPDDACDYHIAFASAV